MSKVLQIKTIGTILLWGIFMLSQLGLSAQANSKIDKEKWEKIAEKYDYSKEKELKEKKEKKQEDKEINEKEIAPKKEKKPYLSETAQEVLKYTLFAIVIILLAFIGFKLISGGTLWNNKKIEKPKVYTLENLEENLDKVNIGSFLDEALSANNYRLAIRLLYLNIIKSLSQKGEITWKKEKTNGDYLRELRKSGIYADFKKCTLAYEYVWFNELKDFAKADFENIRPRFEKFLSEIEQKAAPKV